MEITKIRRSRTNPNTKKAINSKNTLNKCPRKVMRWQWDMFEGRVDCHEICLASGHDIFQFEFIEIMLFDENHRRNELLSPDTRQYYYIYYVSCLSIVDTDWRPNGFYVCKIMLTMPGWVYNLLPQLHFDVKCEFHTQRRISLFFEISRLNCDCGIYEYRIG